MAAMACASVRSSEFSVCLSFCRWRCRTKFSSSPSGRYSWAEPTLYPRQDIHAKLKADIGKDELPDSVPWARLVEAVDNPVSATATAARILSRSLGITTGNQDAIACELRASGTPDSADGRFHLNA